MFEPELGTKYILRVNEYDQFEAKIEQEKFAQDVKVIKGSIVGQASVSMVRAGIPQRIVNEVVNRMSHLINFKTDLHKGDKFAVKYEVSKTEKGDVVKRVNFCMPKYLWVREYISNTVSKTSFMMKKGRRVKPD